MSLTKVDCIFALPCRKRVAKRRDRLYLRRRDTLPQRRAYIWKDTRDGDYRSGNAAG